MLDELGDRHAIRHFDPALLDLLEICSVRSLHWLRHALETFPTVIVWPAGVEELPVPGVVTF